MYIYYCVCPLSQIKNMNPHLTVFCIVFFFYKSTDFERFLLAFTSPFLLGLSVSLEVSGKLGWQPLSQQMFPSSPSLSSLNPSDPCIHFHRFSAQSQMIKKSLHVIFFCLNQRLLHFFRSSDCSPFAL